MNQQKERKRMSIRHKYYFLSLVLSRVGILALFATATLLVGFYKPAYNALDVIIILAAGMILGGIYVRSQDKLEEHYTSKLAEVDGKKTIVETC